MALNISKVVRLGSKAFDLLEPTDGAGVELPLFRLYQTYQVGIDKADRICEKLYKKVF